ncbi:MAG: 5-demethoxyubiquinol-8 5-hydroxylase UbiM [Pseudomonadales bacterium]|nr:5-demethoxyubiquinol-8 5-hydroxylase UbiM [Pseudomonadales bacterium]MDP6471134.1 5-demethoxyubiquinol-8 5-hydroxylase UbiM [Pseudomonadales bacterium]MDP6825680.1 5-demethoxyubiquinol-8 5-hydroxylase UbiM [Pseudomonadales bacterium]MDP6971648.1 5-demethoxyubiquinol-8 5-hydroxylase UbiM [Pseudomonadales bacterium]
MKQDIVVVGGGPAGLSFACSVDGLGLNVCVVEQSPLDSLRLPAEDGREIALTHRSERIMKELGAWHRIPRDAMGIIKAAKVIDGDSPLALVFGASEHSEECLGYLVPNHLIRRSLFEEAQTRSGISMLTDASVVDVHTDEAGAQVELKDGRVLAADLVVAADSRFSSMRRKMGIAADMHDFSRVAIVCRMSHSLPHEHTALECFHYGRTLAVLPLAGDLSSIVITASADEADAIVNMDEGEFNADIEQRLSGRLGSMQLHGTRWSYPLVAVHSRKFAARRFALIGDAAVGMHPVTAHGFNLGLSGQDLLVREIGKAFERGQDAGSREALAGFETAHRRDTRPMYHGTNEIVKLFTDDRAPAKVLRKLVMHVGGNLPPVKQLITRKLTEAESSGGWLPPLPPLPSKLPFPPTLPFRR